MKVSVVMAAYNGSRYIRQQIESILPQLGQLDELIVVDDASTDDTTAIVGGLADRRVRLIRNLRNQGVIRSFERALEHATGEIVFLSDQDDIWRGDKVQKVLGVFATNPSASLVVSDVALIDSDDKEQCRCAERSAKGHLGVLSTLVRNHYQGCAMAFRREVLQAALPFPNGIPMHDSWIGLANALVGNAVFLNEKLLSYRRHGANVVGTKKLAFLERCAHRVSLLLSFLRRAYILKMKRKSLPDGAAGGPNVKRRALVIAPFFASDVGTNRPMIAALALARLMQVDVLTTDFDHNRKEKRQQLQTEQLHEIIYVATQPYRRNVSLRRFLSHVRFSVRATRFVKRNREAYDLFYVTAPFNLLAGNVFRIAKHKPKILDVVDIWPDDLPFPVWLRKVAKPVFFAWKAFFRRAVRQADVVMTCTDSFAEEAKRSGARETKRFYIGHDRVSVVGPKEETFTICYLGNLGRLYDFETLLEVISDRSLRTRLQLFIVGGGDRERWLLSELQKRSVKFRYFGPVYDSQALFRILGRCHVGFNGYVNTKAAFSYKANAYFAAGLPILNSMGGDLCLLVKKFVLGRNFRQRNLEDLRTAVLGMIEEGTAVMERNVREFFDSNLDCDKVKEAIASFVAERFGITQMNFDGSSAESCLLGSSSYLTIK